MGKPICLALLGLANKKFNKPPNGEYLIHCAIEMPLPIFLEILAPFSSKKSSYL